MNKFGDLLNHEFVSMMNKLKVPNNRTKSGITYIEPAHAAIPDSFDWRDEGKCCQKLKCSNIILNGR